MSVNWKLMIDLRERQKDKALGEVRREREAVAQSEAQVQSAQSQLQKHQNNKSALWVDTAAAFQGGLCSVDHLQLAASWGKALDNRALEASQAVQEAQIEVDKKMAVLTERQKVFKEAMSHLEKAKEMQKRETKARHQVMETRAEEVVDEWAAHKWAAQAGHDVRA